MDASRFSALLMLVLLATCTVLGVRLLWRSRARDAAVERWMGSGLVLVSAVAFPMLVASGLGKGDASAVRFPILTVGLVALTAAIGCLARFTHKVFRPEGPVGKGLVAVVLTIEVVAACGIWTGLAEAAPGVRADAAVGEFALLLRMPLMIVWAWTGLEALLEWRKAHRRLALGLTEPVVANRFLLWGLFGVAELLIGAVSVSLQLLGRNPLNDPVAMMVTGTAGIVGSLLVALALCPPRAYLRWVSGSEAAA